MLSNVASIMRKPADWMSRLDDRILEYTLEHGWGAAAMFIEHDNIDVSKSYASRRFSELGENGLLEHMQNGVYHLTIEGKYYLAGGYNVETKEFTEGADPDIDLPTHKEIGEWAAAHCPMS